MVGHLIKASQNKEEATKCLAENLRLLTSVIIRVVETAKSWQQKKVKKTGICVGLFIKAARTIVKVEGNT